MRRLAREGKTSELGMWVRRAAPDVVCVGEREAYPSSSAAAVEFGERFSSFQGNRKCDIIRVSKFALIPRLIYLHSTLKTVLEGTRAADEALRFYRRDCHELILARIEIFRRQAAESATWNDR